MRDPLFKKTEKENESPEETLNTIVKEKDHKSHLIELRKRIGNMDEEEAMVAVRILIDKYPTLIFEALKEAYTDIMTMDAGLLAVVQNYKDTRKRIK